MSDVEQAMVNIINAKIAELLETVNDGFLHTVTEARLVYEEVERLSAFRATVLRNSRSEGD